MVEPNRRAFEAITHSAFSVVNAIPAGKGVTIGIDIPCKVKATLLPKEDHENIVVESGILDPHKLVVITVRYALSHLKSEIPKSIQLNLEIKSKIPTAVGLKSSSAVSAAIAKAVFGLFSKEQDFKSILKVSCIASKDCGASLTGAYDDAAASLLGGLIFTDNSKFKLLKHAKVPKVLGSKVAIMIPDNRKVLTSSVNASAYSNYRVESLNSFDYAREGRFTSAMMLNSIIQCAALKYSLEPVSTALAEGAIASGITGKGPAVVAVCRDSETIHRVKRRWLEDENCSVIETTVLQPEGIVG